MRQIARLAGVSLMTVSRALRGSPQVAAEVRAKVKDVALELGYRPDPEVVKLMHHLRRRAKPTFVGAIAAVTSIPAALEPPCLRRLRENAQARAAELGYALEVFCVDDPEKPNRSLERILLSRGIEGVMLIRMRALARVDRLLEWDKFSTVVATPSVLTPEFPRVGTHFYHNAVLLREELIRRGRTRIGFLGSESFCIRTRHATASAVGWRGMVGGGSAVRPLVYMGWRPGETELSQWFRRERPDAIVVHAEQIIPFVVERLGLSADGRVLVACTNVEPLTTRWPGIDERHDLIGRKAVDVLTGMLYRNERNLCTSRTSTLIEGHWVEPVSLR